MTRRLQGALFAVAAGATIVAALATATLLLWLGRTSRGTKAPDIPPEKLAAELERGLVATGGATREDVSETLGLTTYTYVRWNLDLTLANSTSLPLTLGNDLLVIEVDAGTGGFDGVRQVRGLEVMHDSSTSDPASSPGYELSSRDLHYVDGSRLMTRANTVIRQFANGRGKRRASRDPMARAFGALVAGGQVKLALALDEGAWYKADGLGGVQVVLPEIDVTTRAGIQRVRLIAYLQRAMPAGMEWTVERTNVIPLVPQRLGEMVTSPDSAIVTRVLAAHWLADAAPDVAREVLVSTARPLHHGDLLAACLRLLAAIDGPGLETQAMQLLENRETPQGIRRLAAGYLGRRHDAAAVTLLGRVAGEKDALVADAAVAALGTVGNDEAVSVLAAVFKDPRRSELRATAAAALAETKAASARQLLMDDAGRGHEEALNALVAHADPGTFDFFRDLLADRRHASARDRLIRGMRRSDGHRALPLLLDLLPRESPPAADYPQGTSVVVDELIALDAPEAGSVLAPLARGGNLPALQVLAASKHEDAQAVVAEIARGATGSQLKIALSGLADVGGDRAIRVLRGRLTDADPEVVALALRGLGDCGDASVLGDLLPRLGARQASERQAAAEAVEAVGASEHQHEILAALLATEDEDVARELASALIDAEWRDDGAVHDVAVRLGRARGDLRFQLIRLLRHLSQDALGPTSYSEFEAQPDEWTRRWLDYALRNRQEARE